MSDEEDSAARPKLKKKAKLPSSALLSKPSKPLQVSATETAKTAMCVSEPQLMDKMENVAYRLSIRAHERNKHMNSRCYPKCFLDKSQFESLVRPVCSICGLAAGFTLGQLNVQCLDGEPMQSSVYSILLSITYHCYVAW